MAAVESNLLVPTVAPLVLFVVAGLVSQSPSRPLYRHLTFVIPFR